MTLRRPLLAALALTISVAPRAVFAQAAATPAAPSTDSADVNLHAYVELLRSDVRAQKVAILSQLLEMTEKEDAVFWPIYRAYERELNRLNDERVDTIETYARAYPDVSDELADTLIRRALDVESRRTELLKTYYGRVKSALSSKIGARFVQVEHQLLTLIDLQIASSLPVVK